MASVELKDESPPAPRAEGLLRRLENGWLYLDRLIQNFGGIRNFVFGSVSFLTVSPSPQAGR